MSAYRDDHEIDSEDHETDLRHRNYRDSIVLGELQQAVITKTLGYESLAN